ncbi:MAG: 30S ribosomal protein S27e [Candidatus Parvarchaeota archaeon]
MESIIFKNAESVFMKVRCKKCKNEQIVFSRPSSDVKCLVCGELLVKSTGGKGEVSGEIIETYS